MAASEGWSETIDIEEIQKICDQVKVQVEKMTGKKYLEFKAIKYRTKTGEGKNLLIKVRVGGDNYIHLSVYKDPAGKVSLHGVQPDKTKGDDLEPF